MTNEQLIQKMKEDMQIRNFAKYTYDSYLGKTRNIMKYFKEKQLEEVTIEELREFLLKYLKEEKKINRWVNKLLQFSNKIYLRSNIR